MINEHVYIILVSLNKIFMWVAHPLDSNVNEDDPAKMESKDGGVGFICAN